MNMNMNIGLTFCRKLLSSCLRAKITLATAITACGKCLCARNNELWLASVPVQVSWDRYFQLLPRKPSGKGMMWLSRAGSSREYRQGALLGLWRSFRSGRRWPEKGNYSWCTTSQYTRDECSWSLHPVIFGRSNAKRLILSDFLQLESNIFIAHARCECSPWHLRTKILHLAYNKVAGLLMSPFCLWSKQSSHQANDAGAVLERVEGLRIASSSFLEDRDSPV